MVSATSCPSINDCSNPVSIPKSAWKLLYVDSQETAYPGLGSMAIDNDVNTIWHTNWTSTNTPYPHEIRFDLGKSYQVQKFNYLPRQDGSSNGRIKEFELYISESSTDWGNAVITSSFDNSAALQTASLPIPKAGRYIKLRALSEVNGNNWASAAEFGVVGCNYSATATKNNLLNYEITAFPVPTDGIIGFDLPGNQHNRYNYLIRTAMGAIVDQGVLDVSNDSPRINLSAYKAGIYFISLVDIHNVTYRVKVIRK